MRGARRGEECPLLRQTQLQPLAESRRELYGRKIVRHEERTTHSGVQACARLAEAAMACHGVQLDATQRVVDVCIVLAAKLPTIHEGCTRVIGCRFGCLPYPRGAGRVPGRSGV